MATPLRLSTTLRGDLVTVKVGPIGKTYTVHKALLVHHSGYFRKALKGSWQEAKEGTITLSDVEPHIFEMFAEWLYTQATLWEEDGWLENFESDPGVTTESYRYHESLATLQAFVFGDRFLAPAFRAVAMDGFALLGMDPDSTDEFYHLVVYAFDNIPADSIMLQYLVDRFCEIWNGFSNDTPPKGLPEVFLFRCLRRFAETRDMDSDSYSKEQCCIEHLTAVGQEKCAKEKIHMNVSREGCCDHFFE